MSWGGFGHGLLGALGKIGGGVKRGLAAGADEDHPIFQHDPTREALMRLLLGGEKPLPPWQGPEMPPAVKFQRADADLLEKLAHPSTPKPVVQTRRGEEDRRALESLPPLDDDTLIARDL